jgi:hypothetical protein
MTCGRRFRRQDGWTEASLLAEIAESDVIADAVES